MSVKRGFVFYFDNYPTLAALPAEQRGWMLSALMVYADRVWREPGTTLEEVMEGFPQLSQETRVACGFMGASILRDTQKWLSRQQRGSAAPARSPAPVRSPAPAQQQPVRARKGRPAPPTPEERAASDRRAVEDMERMRRLMERFREEEKQDA